MQFVMVIQLVCNYDMAFFDNSQWFVQLPAFIHLVQKMQPLGLYFAMIYKNLE